uniref:Uncharacterized protein n=1 Tax=Anguilla anguilla TaxID=7936 RepID=A0A0E9RP85_ANGAN
MGHRTIYVNTNECERLKRYVFVHAHRSVSYKSKIGKYKTGCSIPTFTAQ